MTVWKLSWVLGVIVGGGAAAVAQSSPAGELPSVFYPGPPNAAFAGSYQEPVLGDDRANKSSHPATEAESLYLRLSNVGLDASRVYHVRNATIERESLHLALDDGTIAFTQDVMGRVTGAFFAGEGEILLVPAGRAEQQSLKP